MKCVFKDILEIKNGKNQKNVENSDGVYPIYGSGGIMGYADDYICPSDTVIIGRKGNINSPIYVEEPFWNVDTAFGLIANRKYLIAKYLFYFCKKFNFEKLNKAVTIPSLTKSDLLEIKIDLPDKSSQQLIVDRLNTVERVIELRQQELSQLDNLIKARFVELFGHPDTNEKGWKMNTFGDICTVRQGLQIPISKRLTEYDDDCYEYITVQYLHGGKEREYIKSPKATVICTKDDILMTRTGNTGLVVTGVEGVFHNNFFLIDFDRNRYDKDFLVQYLNLDTIQADILRRAGTSTIPDLNHGEFYKIPVFEPLIGVQHQFKAFLKQVDKSKFSVFNTINILFNI